MITNGLYNYFKLFIVNASEVKSWNLPGVEKYFTDNDKKNGDLVFDVHGVN